MSRAWDLPERDVTPESVALSRRKWLKRAAYAGLGVAGSAGAGLWWLARRGTDAQVLATGQVEALKALHPAATNPQFTDGGRRITSEAKAARYCNFYEFTSTKRVWRVVDDFRPFPWTLRVDGLVRKPRTYQIDELARAFPLEERIYRHRCVEAWAMVVPWTGFPLASLVKAADHLAAARYLRFVSFDDASQAPNQTDRSNPWPYNEGLTLAEATGELTFLATGMYGHPLLRQHGAPIRLVVPWKYGFKSAKSLVHIEFTSQQPATFWNTLVPQAYDFTANVNPDVPHPSWSQKTERMLGSGETYPTKLYNGYGPWVAHLYS